MVSGGKTTLCLYGRAYDEPVCMFYPNTPKGREDMRYFVDYYGDDDNAVWMLMVIEVPYKELKSFHVMSEPDTKKILANR